MSQTTTPASPSGAPGSALPSEPRHPILQACSRVFDAFRGGNNCEVLQAFDELQAMELEEAPEFRSDVLAAWGRGILTAAHMCSDDEEHLQEMLEDYENRFGTCSSFLRVLMVDGSSPADVLERFWQLYPAPPMSPEEEAAMPDASAAATAASAAMDMSNSDSQMLPLVELPSLVVQPPAAGPRGQYILDAVEGILEKFRNFTCDDAKALMGIVKALGVERYVPNKLVEKLQRPFMAKMKSKAEDVDVEAVFEEMTTCGLKPVNAFPFTFVFMKKQPSKPLIDYYYMLMLECGVKPGDSIYRLLERNPSLTKEELSFVKRRKSGSSEMDDWFEKKLSKLRSVENERVYEDATRLFLCMLFDGIVPDKHAFNKIIAMSRSDPAMAEAWFRKMVAMGVQPNALTFINFITLWKHCKATDSVDRLIVEMTNRGMQVDTTTYVSLLELYVKASNRARAQACFKALLSRGDATLAVYNTMIGLGPFDWGFGCLAAMLSDGLELNVQTKEALVSLARDDISNGIIDDIASCGWSKTGILTKASLINPARGTTPSLQDCMRLMMREMKMSDEDLTKRSELLSAEIDLAKRM